MGTVLKWLARASLKVVLWAFKRPLVAAAAYTGLCAMQSAVQGLVLKADGRTFFERFRENMKRDWKIIGAVVAPLAVYQSSQVAGVYASAACKIMKGMGGPTGVIAWLFC